MEFVPGLKSVSADAVPELRAEATAIDAAVFEINMTKKDGREAFFDSIVKSFPLDPHLSTSNSWDALNDSLSGGLLLDVRAGVIIVIWSGTRYFRSSDRRQYKVALHVLRNICSNLGYPDRADVNPKCVSVFLTHRPGIFSSLGSALRNMTLWQGPPVDRVPFDQLRGRLLTLLTGFEDRLTSSQTDTIHASIDAGELIDSLADMAAALYQARSGLTAEERAEMLALVADMHMVDYVSGPIQLCPSIS